MASGEEGPKIIIAYDGSENSEYALEWYVKNIHKPGNHVIMIHVPQINDMLNSTRWASTVQVYDHAMLEAMLKEEQERVRKDLEKFADKMKALELGGKVKSVAASKPGEAIVKECEDATMVVVGSRGLGAVRRTLMGSVSDYLVHHCHCPVLVIRHPDHHHHHHHHHGDGQKSK